MEKSFLVITSDSLCDNGKVVLAQKTNPIFPMVFHSQLPTFLRGEGVKTDRVDKPHLYSQNWVLRLRAPTLI